MDRKQCLTAAMEATQGREESYGSPARSFRQTAEIWSVILGVTVQPWQVPLCLDALKTVRIMAEPCHLDSWIDKAGYSALGAEVVGK